MFAMLKGIHKFAKEDKRCKRVCTKVIINIVVAKTKFGGIKLDKRKGQRRLFIPEGVNSRVSLCVGFPRNLVLAQ